MPTEDQSTLSILRLRLEGPLQSWGGNSKWNYRCTNLYPTKSAVIGLVACAFGYEKGDPRISEVLCRNLMLGIRIDKPGKVLRDYQTVRGFIPLANGKFRYNSLDIGSDLEHIQENKNNRHATLESYRDYLQDASFLVLLGSSDKELIEKCDVALRNPKWPMYLGRKSCIPSVPIYNGISYSCDSLFQALCCLDIDDSDLGEDKNNKLIIEVPKRSKDTIIVQDKVETNEARVYGYTYYIERYISSYPLFR